MPHDLAAAMQIIGQALQDSLAKIEAKLTAIEQHVQWGALDERHNVHTKTGTDMLSGSQAAEHLGVAPGTLEIWRCKRKGPPFIKVGRLVRYKRQDLDRWLGERVHNAPLAVTSPASARPARP